MGLPRKKSQDEPVVIDSRTMTVEEYLELDRNSEIKYEYADGRIYAMTGTSLKHNLIAANIIRELGNQLGKSPCLVVGSDMRVKVDSKKAFRYPDVSIVCEEPVIEGEQPGTLVNPVVIVEVLSPSTALLDHNEKLREYRQIESLMVYILVSQHEARIERFIRQDVNNWLYTDFTGLDAMLDIPSLDVKLALADVYDKVKFEVDDEQIADDAQE